MPGLFFHANSIQSLPENKWEATDPRFKAGNILVSFRELNLVFIIDKATGTIVWSMVNKTVGQHHARMIESPLPGAGNILIFDNGFNGTPPLSWRGYTRVIEVDPVTGATVWAYQCRVPGCESAREFSSPSLGSAQRLPNGNTLITEAQSEPPYFFEVAPSGVTVWQFRQISWVYRGYRWPKSWQNGPVLFRW